MHERPSILGLGQGLTCCAQSQTAARFRWGAGLATCHASLPQRTAGRALELCCFGRAFPGRPALSALRRRSSSARPAGRRAWWPRSMRCTFATRLSGADLAPIKAAPPVTKNIGTLFLRGRDYLRQCKTRISRARRIYSPIPAPQGIRAARADPGAGGSERRCAAGRIMCVAAAPVAW